MDKQQRNAMEQRLKTHWGQCALNRYRGCGYPDADWIEQAISNNYPAIESLDDQELEAACAAIPVRTEQKSPV
ncbi:MAG: hypothetical protein V7629_01970 [Motiliproteus sp.]